MNPDPIFDAFGPRPGEPSSSNETSAAAAPGAVGSAAIAGLDAVEWQPSYDRASVDAYLSAVEAEKVRLAEAIRAAEERAEAARVRLEAHKAERDARVAALVAAAREEMDRLESEQRAAITAITEATEDEVRRIRDRAESEAAAVRDVARSLGTLTSAPSPGSPVPGADGRVGDDLARPDLSGWNGNGRHQDHDDGR